MKAKIEIEIPEGLCGEHEESDVIAQKLQALLNTAERPIELSSVIEISADPVWQVWFKDKNGDGWVVADSTSFGVPGSAVQGDETYKILQHMTCFTSNDALVYLGEKIFQGHTSPVIRHEDDRNCDPITVTVYTPDHGETHLDISSFLMEAREIDLETIALSRWEIGFLHVGVALEGLKQRSHPAFRAALEGKKLNETMDGTAAIFMPELFHDRDDFEAYLLKTKGHKIAAFIDSEKLEAWLRHNRSDVNYPNTTPTP